MTSRELSEDREADVVVKYENKRFRQGINSTIYVIGLPGTGKSSLSQRLAELITQARGQSVETFIVDSLLGLLKALRKSKEGDIIIIEEVSVLFPSRRAMARDNVSIGKILDTCRKKMLCIISNAPIWTSIDSHMRALGNVLIQTLSINKTHKVVVSKFHRLQTDPRTGKTYTHPMLRNGKDIHRLFTRMPNMEKWDEYEKTKDKFMDSLYERLENEQILKQKKLDKAMNQSEPKIESLTPRELQAHQLVNIKNMTQLQASKELGVSAARVNQILKKIRQKSLINKGNEQNKVNNSSEPPIK